MLQYKPLQLDQWFLTLSCKMKWEWVIASSISMSIFSHLRAFKTLSIFTWCALPGSFCFCSMYLKHDAFVQSHMEFPRRDPLMTLLMLATRYLSMRLQRKFHKNTLQVPVVSVSAKPKLTWVCQYHLIDTLQMWHRQKNCTYIFFISLRQTWSSSFSSTKYTPDRKNLQNTSNEKNSTLLPRSKDLQPNCEVSKMIRRIVRQIRHIHIILPTQSKNIIQRSS